MQHLNTKKGALIIGKSARQFNVISLLKKMKHLFKGYRQRHKKVNCIEGKVDAIRICSHKKLNKILHARMYLYKILILMKTR